MALGYLIAGRYVDVRVILGRENLYAFVLNTTAASALRHRIIRALLCRPLQRKPAEEWSEEGRELMETCGKRSDFVDFASLRPIINETQRNTE